MRKIPFFILLRRRLLSGPKKLRILSCIYGDNHHRTFYQKKEKNDHLTFAFLASALIDNFNSGGLMGLR